MESETQLSKTISISSAGKLCKDGSTKMHRGTAHRLTLSGTPTDQLAQLAYRMDLMTSREALVCAAPPDGQDAWPIVAKEEMPSNPGTLARTADTFKARPGPALFCLDFDTAEFPPFFLARLREAGSISSALAEVHPAIAEAAELSRASVSSGILLDGKPQPASGQHRYYIASDGLQVATFVDILAARMKLAGFLWGKIAITGAVLPRTLFDVDASKAASRLFYEADAVLSDSRLAYAPDARKPTVRPGGVLDVADIAPLSADEKERLAAMEDALRLSLEPEAAAQRSVYEAERIEKLVAQGKSREAAQRVVSAAVERHELTGDFDIQLDSGGSVTVRDILRTPSSFHRQRCSDPLEPDYNGGRNIAVIFADGNAIRINSRAHGGMDYWLVPEPTEHFEVIETPPDTSEHEPRHEPPRALFFDASALSGMQAPERVWIVPDLIPSDTVTLFSGDGGTGKSLLSLQLAVAVASGTQWIGMEAKPGTAVFLSAEDDRDELHRRLFDIARAEGLEVAELSNLKMSSLAGEDALLAVLNGGMLVATQLYAEIDAYLATVGPTLVVLDTSADLYGGNENDRANVRQFVGMLRRLALKYRCAVVLLSHPSVAGMLTGTGQSGSTAWNNSVRSRIYLERIKQEGGKEDDPNVRRLSNKKSNYGPMGVEYALRWQGGVFVSGGAVAEVRAEMEDKAKRVFLELLRQFNVNGMPVNPSSSASYAPKVFADHPHADGLSKAAFKVAMANLLKSEEIKVIVTGPPSRQVRQLVIAEPTSPFGERE